MNLQSTDRLQVRDLIEQLQQFDPRARITGCEFEIRGASKGDDALVYIDTDKADELVALEEESADLESRNATLKKENEELRKKLKA